MELPVSGNLPPLDTELLAKMGIATAAVPIPPVCVDKYRVAIPSATPQRPKPLTSDECISLFGTREAVMMNFIPRC